MMSDYMRILLCEREVDSNDNPKLPHACHQLHMQQKCGRDTHTHTHMCCKQRAGGAVLGPHQWDILNPRLVRELQGMCSSIRFDLYQLFMAVN
jgi:hypothetical protein